MGKESHQNKTYFSFLQGSEGVNDINYPGKTNELVIETDYYRCELSETQGIIDLLDKKSGQSIFKNDQRATPFSGIYEYTPIKTNPCDERRRMGRNRKGKGVKRYYSKLTDIKTISSGEVFQEVELDYTLEGTQLYTTIMKFYNKLPLIEFNVRIQKNNTWNPENLYIAMPFIAENDLYAEKSGQIFRPAIDQLPGTNTDFYLLDSGLFYLDDKDKMVGMCFKDTPLITLGNLNPGLIELCSEKTAYKNRETVYAWVMNNFWETNFKVDLSGFYEFEFDLFTSPNVQSTEMAQQLMREKSLGIVSIVTDQQH